MLRVLASSNLLTVGRGENTKALPHDSLTGLVESGRGGLIAVSGRAQLTALPIVDATGRAHPQGVSLKDEVSGPVVIFALRFEESKGENDLPQLQNQMPEVWKGP